MNARQESDALNSDGLITDSEAILQLHTCLVNPNLYTTSINELERFGNTQQFILSK